MPGRSGLVGRALGVVDRDRWFTAQEALEYGFVDHVVSRAAMTDQTNPVTDN